MRERLTKEPSDIVCKYIFSPSIESESQRSFENMIDINIAHALMLEKQRIISSQDAKVLCQSLLRILSEGAESIPLSSAYEDYYFNFEKRIIDIAGIDVGGRLHTARSRNDLNSTLIRMNARDSLLRIFPIFLSLLDSLLEKARDSADVLITGYTHMQPAQPSVLAHYYLAICEALERDFQRLMDAFNRMNLCPLGSGAFAGTSFNIDRNCTSELLGFDVPMMNSLDSVASRDYLVEIAGDFVSIGSTLSRFVTDLYFWTTDEFGYVEMDDSVAICSSIMPQKKNPITLEIIRAKSSHLLGAYVSIASTLRGIPYGHCKDIGSETAVMFWESCEQLESMLQLAIVTLNTLQIRRDRMSERTRMNFSTATDLADELVRTENMPFRVAHQIVGKIVGSCINQGLRVDDITSEMLHDSSEQYCDRAIDWSQERIQTALNASDSVEKKISYGGVSVQECKNMIQSLTGQVQQDRNDSEALAQKLGEARISLRNQANM